MTVRIRSILPDFYRSEDVAAMDWHTRLVFIGLWSYVDDNGVGRDVARLIASDLFPLDGDPTETLRRVSEALNALSEGGQIRRYRVGGVAYLFVVQWDKYQRVQNPGKARYPRPTSENVDPPETLTTSSGESPETLSPGEGEKGRRGEVLSSDSSDVIEDRFDEFWSHYPRRDGKQDARKAWRQVTKKIDPQTVIDGLTAYRFSPDRQFIPLPASWLRGQRWEDEQDSGTVVALRPGETLTAEQVDDILGPDQTWQLPMPPPELDPEDDWPSYQQWCQQTTAEHRADRHRLAVAALAKRGQA